MSDAPDLDTCPFCDGEAEIIEAVEAGPQAYCVCCKKCLCSSRVIFALKDDVTFELISAWNIRADTVKQPKVQQLVWDKDRIASPFPYQIWSDNGGSGAPDDPFEQFHNFRVFEPFLMCSIGPKGDGSDEFLTIEEAKAAAQADFEQCILSALAQGDG